MNERIAQLKVPGYGDINAPDGIPQGGQGTLGNAIGVGIQLFLIVVIVAALFYLVWAGINWIRSSGDPQKIESARQQIIFAIIGLFVSFFAFAMINFFGGLFNVSLL